MLIIIEYIVAGLRTAPSVAVRAFERRHKRISLIECLCFIRRIIAKWLDKVLINEPFCILVTTAQVSQAKYMTQIPSSIPVEVFLDLI